jgi:CheY-like chemotaxis protein
MAVGLIQAIEDNKRNRKLVRGVLTFKGSVVTKAETGAAHPAATPADRFLGEVWVNERG